jgi:hypothetical protein
MIYIQNAEYLTEIAVIILQIRRVNNEFVVYYINHKLSSYIAKKTRGVE